MPKKIRRAVTGHNEEGKSMIISDDPSPHVLAVPGVEDFALTNLWVTDGSPADNAGHADAACRPGLSSDPCRRDQVVPVERRQRERGRQAEVGEHVIGL